MLFCRSSQEIESWRGNVIETRHKTFGTNKRSSMEI